MLEQYAEELTKVIMMMGVNLTYAALCIVLGIVAMVGGYKLFDRFTPFNTGEELKNENTAVAIFNGAIVLGVAICSGIIIGLACN